MKGLPSNLSSTKVNLDIVSSSFECANLLLCRYKIVMLRALPTILLNAEKEKKGPLQLKKSKTITK